MDIFIFYSLTSSFYRKKSDKLLDWNIREYDWGTVKKSKAFGDYETTNVWKIDPTFDRVHSAVFPIELCNRVIKFYSYRGDLVFDPFAGSGTLGRAAKDLGRTFFLTEKEEKYINRIREEINRDANLFSKNVGQPTFLDMKEFILSSEQYDTDRNGHDQSQNPVQEIRQRC